MEENASLRKELEQKLLAMLNPLKARFSEEKAGLPLGGFAAGYGMKIAEMEGALRLLWGLTPYWAGGGTQAEDWKDHYLNCIIGVIFTIGIKKSWKWQHYLFNSWKHPILSGTE